MQPRAKWWLTLGLGLAHLGIASPSPGQIEAKASATVKVGSDKHPCGGKEQRECIPADIAVYAPLELRAGRWDLNGVDRDYDPTEFTVGVSPDITIQAGGATSRSRITASLGGGNSGFAGELGGIWMFGGRLSMGRGEVGGGFARMGVDASLGGNADFYHSHLELPRFELGYQLIESENLFLELAGRGGLLLTGRHRVFDRTRDIGFSLDGGGFLTLQMEFIRVQIDAVRIYESKHAPKTPIDRGQADVCALLGGLAICLTASTDRAEILSEGETLATRGAFLGAKIAATDARILSDAF